MAITTLDGIIAAAKQKVLWRKTSARTTNGGGWFSMIDLAGSPGAGTLAGANTTTGVIVDQSTAGMPTLTAFGGGNTGYLSRVDFSSPVAMRLRLYDLIWKCGAHTFNANQAITSPAFTSRLPSSDYTQLEMWVETVTAATGNLAVSVTYTNELGVAGRIAGPTGLGAAPTLGRCWQLPLQAGDRGVQSISNITGSVATVGTFNVLLMRPIWTGRIASSNNGDIHDALRTGMPQLYSTSAIYPLLNPDSTTTSVTDVEFEIANG